MKNKLLCCFTTAPQGKCASAALLFLRLVAGAAFMFHGWGKIQNPMSWMGPESPVPGFLQFLAAFSEFGGGLAWMVGLLTPLFSLGLMFTMIVATLLHMMVLKDPFVAMKGGSSYELAAVYLAVSILFLSIGSGKFSLDAIFFKRKE